jgi:hypothetical protein
MEYRWDKWYICVKLELEVLRGTGSDLWEDDINMGFQEIASEHGKSIRDTTGICELCTRE